MNTEKMHNKSDRSKAISSVFSSSSVRLGSYSVAYSLIAIAIAVIIVLAVSVIPAHYTKLDMSNNKLFELGAQTVSIAADLTDDIDIYWMVAKGEENSTLQSLLERYDELSDHITVTKIDPIERPSFAAQYTTELENNNSLIVVGNGYSRFIDYYSIFVYDFSYYQETGTYLLYFNGEDEITSAIDYVTNTGDLPKMYLLEGHGEDVLSGSFLTTVKKQNIVTESLSLLSNDRIPSDCSCLAILNPENDISDAEKDIIRTYLQGGGDLILVTCFGTESQENILELTRDYGVSLVDGIIVEGDTDHCITNYNYYLLPDLNNHEITDPLIENNYRVLIPVAQGLVVDETLPDGLSVTELLTTSDKAYAKARENIETADYVEGDITGPFAVGTAMDNGSSRIVWYTTSYLLDETVDSKVSGANKNLFSNSVSWLCGKSDSITITSKSMNTEMLTLTQQENTRLSILLVGVIPAVFLILGIVMIIRRGKR